MNINYDEYVKYIENIKTDEELEELEKSINALEECPDKTSLLLKIAMKKVEIGYTPKIETSKSVETINDKAKLQKNLTVAIAVGSAAMIVLASAILLDKNNSKTMTEATTIESTMDTDANVMDTSSTEVSTSSITSSTEATNYVVNNEDIQNVTAVHFDYESRNPKFDEEIQKLDTYLNDCGFKKRELHWGNEDLTYDLSLTDFVSDGITIDDGSVRQWVEKDSNFGDVCIIPFLGEVKKVKTENGGVISFDNKAESYGMQYWIDGLAKQNNTETIDMVSISKDMQAYLTAFSQRFTNEFYDVDMYDAIYNETDASIMTASQYEAFEDDLYTLWYSFRQTQGIDDYYDILDEKTKATETLITDYNDGLNNEYVPMIDRGTQLVK